MIEEEYKRGLRLIKKIELMVCQLWPKQGLNLEGTSNQST